ENLQLKNTRLIINQNTRTDILQQTENYQQ
ncbi:MAG: hypothetical protein ACI9IA_001839, partial [Enterobacterales bacterium]